MVKKFLSVILALALVLSIVPVYAEEAQTDISVYITISKYSEIVNDKNGEAMAIREISLTGKESYTLDDAFRLAHELYYEEGEAGYASSEGDWGLGVDKLWGDTSYNFGYQVNGGSEVVMGPGHILNDGEYIDAFIYKNLYPDTEGYAKFDSFSGSASVGEEIELTLSYVSGYDESWNMIFSPCSEAVITINGEESEFITDEDGKASIRIENAGTYVISAKKEKVLNEQTTSAITAPVFVATITENLSVEIIHNIASYYKETDFEQVGGNLPWIIADMVVYEKLFAESENVLSESRKEEAAEIIANSGINATVPGDMAKAIIALSGLGYDATNIYTKNYKRENIVKKLTNLVDDNDPGVTNIYTLPYVIIALSQSNDYASAEQMEKLINSAIESKESWQDTEFGTDAMTPFLLALSSYYNTNDDVKNALDEASAIVLSKQREDGLIDGFEGYESASTGLAICGLSAMGYDSTLITNGGASLIDGVLSTANEEKNGFSNAFATEQGLRGLLAWQLAEKNEGKMYDFSDCSKNELNLSKIEHCPVIFKVSPDSATVTIEGHEEKAKNLFDLEKGVYEYTVSASGYVSSAGIVEISDSDDINHALKTVEVSLWIKSSGGGGGGGGVIKPSKKPEEEKEETEILTPAFSKDTFADVKEDDWYYPAVKFAYEKDLIKGTDLGFEPNTSMTRAMLVTILHRFANAENISEGGKFLDVSEDSWYAKSVNWALENKIVSGISDTEFAPDDVVTREQIAVILYRFALFCGYDVSGMESADISSYNDLEKISDYATDAMKYAVGAGVITGRTEYDICPKDSGTRAEVATMLMRFAEGIKQLL